MLIHFQSDKMTIIFLAHHNCKYHQSFFQFLGLKILLRSLYTLNTVNFTPHAIKEHLKSTYIVYTNTDR